MRPPIIARQQLVERGQQVVFGARAKFDDRDTGRRMRHKDVEQPVAGISDESVARGGHVVHARLPSGSYGDRLAAHPLIMAERAGSRVRGGFRGAITEDGRQGEHAAWLVRAAPQSAVDGTVSLVLPR